MTPKAHLVLDYKLRWVDRNGRTVDVLVDGNMSVPRNSSGRLPELASKFLHQIIAKNHLEDK